MSPHQSWSLTSLSATTTLRQTSLSVTFTNDEPQGFQEPQKQGVLTVFLDRSGSMSGRPLAYAKQALAIAIGPSLEAFLYVYLVAFDHETVSHCLSSLTPRVAQQTVNDVRSRGGTSFATAFEALRRITSDHYDERHAVVFFTDGCDTGQFNIPSRRNETIAELQRHLRAAAKSCLVHCIGLSPHHDAAMLTALSGAGTAPGTFIYVASADQINSAVEEVFASSGRPSVDASLALLASDGSRSVPTSVSIKLESEDDMQYTCSMLLPSNVLPVTAKITLAGAEYHSQISFEQDKWERLQVEALDPQAREVLSIEYAADVHNVINSRICQDVSQIPLRIEDKLYLRGLQKDYEFFSADIFTRILPCLRRHKQAKTMLLESLSLIKQFHADVLVNALRHGGFENEKFAKLASIAFAGVRNRRTQNVLGKRAARNVERLDALDIRVGEIVRSIDFDDGSFSDVDEYGRCVLSFMNYKEAMESGDCLCLGLEIRRPETAIVDSSRLIVKNISTSPITAESFLDAVQFYLRPEASRDESETSIHGGFQLGESGTVITGQSREIINGALPLFINSKHWEIAKLRMEPLFGWMTTLDVLGFSYEQVTTIPFLVLQKLRSTASTSDYARRVESWVVETCLYIFKESKTLQENLFVPDVQGSKKSLLRYLKEPSSRLPDVVPNHEVFCFQLYVAGKLPDGRFQLTAQETKELGRYVVVEETRRRLRHSNCLLSQSQRDGAIGTLVGFNVEVHFVPLGHNLETILEATSFSLSFEDCLSALEIPQWDLCHTRQPERKTMRMFDSLSQNFRRVLGQTASLSPSQILAVLVLHLQYPRASDTRARDQYRQDLEIALNQPKAFLKECFTRAVVLKLKRLYESLMKSSKMVTEQRRIRDFLEADDVDEAAQMLSKRLYLGRNLGYYARALSGLPLAEGFVIDCIVRNPLEKIHMLMSGTFASTGLYSDRDDRKRRARFGGLAWKPRKRYVRKWFKRFAIDATNEEQLTERGVDEATTFEWKRMFPWCDREIGIWSTDSVRTPASENVSCQTVSLRWDSN